MNNRATNIIAVCLLVSLFLVTLSSIKDDSFTFDETAHVAAGYSYLSQKDYRLNPEHPPLIKDLAALPLLFLDLNFPKDHPTWVQEEPPQWWVQFDFANQFLYHSNNNPDQILFWTKLPMILLLIFLGWFLFYWTRELFGNKVGLIVLFLFSFSPTFLAHGRLVTTDVGAASGVVLATYFWLKFLRSPTKTNIILAGLIFGLTMLIKFSLILLIPFFALITLIYAWLNSKKPLANILKYFGLALLAGIIGVVFIVWPVYQHHIFNYSPEQQIRDTQFLLTDTSVPESLIEINLWMAERPILRPFSQYLLGLLLAINRSMTGHTTFFLGEIATEGWPSYFPIVYLIKEPLAFHILTLIALLYLAWSVKRPFWQNTFQRIKSWIQNHFPEFAMLTFLGIYWLTSLTSKLNIGVRHLLPAFPFTMILVGAVICNYWLTPTPKFGVGPLNSIHLTPFASLGREKIKYFLIGILLLWQAFSVATIYPYFLAYFNELTAGPNQGYIYVVDSNLDWGQNLKRLASWIEINKIDKIYLDYFGGGDPEYYLKEKYAPWWGKRNPNELPKGSYLAVSATQLQGGRALFVKGSDLPSDYYMWLYQHEPPIAKIGYSIFIYHID